MYNFEQVKTNDLGADGLPIFEIIVRDWHGHAVHHDCCYSSDLDRMMRELEAIFHAIPDPWCVKMQRRADIGMLNEILASGLTKQEALDMCAYYDWVCVDQDGYLWELHAEADFGSQNKK